MVNRPGKQVTLFGTEKKWHCAVSHDARVDGKVRWKIILGNGVVNVTPKKRSASIFVRSFLQSRSKGILLCAELCIQPVGWQEGPGRPAVLWILSAMPCSQVMSQPPLPEPSGSPVRPSVAATVQLGSGQSQQPCLAEKSQTEPNLDRVSCCGDGASWPFLVLLREVLAQLAFGYKEEPIIFPSFRLGFLAATRGQETPPWFFCFFSLTKYTWKAYSSLSPLDRCFW
jgi:hypothetical protein